jgi:hypothetical protein
MNASTVTTANRNRCPRIQRFMFRCLPMRSINRESSGGKLKLGGGQCQQRVANCSVAVCGPRFIPHCRGRV